MFKNIKTKISYSIGATALLLSPVLAFGASSPNNLFDVIRIIFNLLGALIPVVFTLALIGFLWGAALFIFQSEDASKREEGRKFMLYGIIALFVMVAIWGLVGILGDTFGVDTGGIPFLPGFGGSGGSSGSVDFNLVNEGNGLIRVEPI